MPCISETWKTFIKFVLARRNVFSNTLFREFIEAQKIWVIKDRERVDKENREIARFIEDKDRWKVQVIIQSSKSVCCISCHIFCCLYFWLCKKWTYLIVYILVFQVAEDAKERRAIKVCIILMYSSKVLIRIQIVLMYSSQSHLTIKCVVESRGPEVRRRNRSSAKRRRGETNLNAWAARGKNERSWRKGKCPYFELH